MAQRRDGLEVVRTAAITSFISAQVARRGLAPKTANRYREILMRLYNWAMEQKNVRMPNDKHPASKVERYKEPAPEIRFLTMKHIDEQLDVLAHQMKFQAMTATLIYAGASAGRNFCGSLPMTSTGPPAR